MSKEKGISLIRRAISNLREIKYHNYNTLSLGVNDILIQALKELEDE